MEKSFKFKQGDTAYQIFADGFKNLTLENRVCNADGALFYTVKESSNLIAENDLFTLAELKERISNGE